MSILIYYYSCCEAKSHKIPTCSDPSAESSYPNDEIFCPAPPVLSITDRASASPPVGHLDDINTYVAEKLLQYIDEVNIGIFESLFQVKKNGHCFATSLNDTLLSSIKFCAMQLRTIFRHADIHVQRC